MPSLPQTTFSSRGTGVRGNVTGRGSGADGEVSESLPLDSQPAEGAGQGNDGRVVADRLLVTGSEAAGVFEKIDRALHRRAFLVLVTVMGDLRQAVGLRWNHGDCVHLAQLGADGIGVVGLVGKEASRGAPRNQLRCGLRIVALAFGDLKRKGQSQGVDDQVNLGRRPTARAADRLLLGPPFPPAACW